MKHLLPIFVAICLIETSAIAQTAEEKVIANTNVEELLILAQELQTQDSLNLQKALNMAKLYNWPLEISTESTYMQLVGLNDDGTPRYNSTNNRTAARTISTNKVHANGGQGLNLEGQNMTIAEWDAGGVRSTHREFGTRVNRRDGTSGNHSHATHVAGTLIASGVTASAKGMAPKANLWAYDWNNDASEMASAAASGILVSNHSYGTPAGWSNSSGSWVWWGSPQISQLEDYKFGFYDTRTRDWDRIAKAAPYYLIVKAAGNDRNDNHTGSHRVWSGSSWITSSTRRDPDGQYDCLPTYATAKNILTVGAVNDLNNGYTGPNGVSMTGFSSWGPTDDGRIKPDIVGNGRGVYSCNSTGNSAYYSSDGTSMASPSVAGSCLLLQQHYKNVKGSYMRASTLKGLVIHTADEAGSAAGPDYKFGWGLMNTFKATQVISNSKVQIEELSLTNSAKYEKMVFSNGSNPIKVTICWTDVEGTPNSPSLDPTTIKLVNDLDVRLVNVNNGSTYYPYKLNPVVPAAAATKGDNVRDNVEHIYYSNLPAGNYYLRVTHKGNLSGGKQDFSLIAEGFIDGPRANFVASKYTGCIGDTIYFYDRSSNGVTAWQWTFIGANSVNSNMKDPFAVYSNAGTFDVTLRGYNGALFDIRTVKITISENPDAGVIETDTAYCVSEQNSIVLTPVEANGKWSGGNWMPYVDSCKFRPNLLQPGVYKAEHKLTNSSGCVDIDSIEVKIVGLPEVSLNLEKETVCSDASAFTLTGGAPSGGEYKIEGNSSQRLDPGALTIGSKRITYSYIDSNNCEATAERIMWIEDCTGISEVNGGSDLKIYPNPFKSNFSVRNLTTQSEFSITTIEGKGVDFILKRQENEVTIDLTDSESGVYLLYIKEEGVVTNTVRLIKK